MPRFTSSISCRRVPAKTKFEPAKGRLNGPWQGLQDAHRLAMLVKASANRAQVSQSRLHRLPRAGFIARRRVERKAAVIDGDQHGVASQLVD